MKKLFFLLIMMCILFTGCKKDQKTEQNLNAETTSVQMETDSDNSDTERLSAPTSSPAESIDSGTSTNQTNTPEKSSSQTSVTTSTKTNPSESTEVSLDAENALRQAVMDEEEKAAIKAVQEEEQLNYYKNPTLDFDREAYANLNFGRIFYTLPSSQNGHNIHQYFFESRPMSGTDILYLQKASEGYSDIAFDADQVKSSTGASLENSECLTYQNDSAYLELHQNGTCMMYNKENISRILRQEIPSGIWNPLQDSQSHSLIWSGEEFMFSDDPDYLNSTEVFYPLNGENISVADAYDFLIRYFRQSIESGWISSLYYIQSFADFITVKLIEYENGSYGYYFTIPVSTIETSMILDSTERTAYLRPDRAIQRQCIQVLMLSKDSVDYLYLPPTLTRSPDYQQTLPGTYCTLTEACEILSGYLSPDHVYDINEVNIFYETVFLGDLGIVQSPMWHFEVTSLTGEEAKYDTLYADIDLETKELYISYR